MKTPSFFYSKEFNLLSLILTPLSWIYITIFIIIAFYKKYFKSFQISKKVICIGNFVSGGSGKTEIAMSIGRILKQKQIKFCYLTRGYNRKSKDDLFISHLQDVDAEMCGDEPVLLSKISDVFITNDRKSTLLSDRISNYDYIIMDDGMFDLRFKKYKNIVLFDSGLLDGNKKLLPAGPKRCIYNYFRRYIDILIFTNYKLANDDNILKLAQSLNQSEYLHSKIVVKNNEIDINSKYIAFSGLAVNEKFYNTLRNNGYNIVRTIDFPDHYYYTITDIENIINLARNLNAKIITTAKDYVKIDKKFQNAIQYLEIEHKIICDDYTKIL